MIDERARNTPPLRVNSDRRGKDCRRSRAVCAKADAWGVLWFYKTKAPPTGAASDSVLSLPTPPQGGSHFISICRLRNSSPFFGGLFQQPPMMQGAIRPLRPENKTLRRRIAPGEVASPREGAEMRENRERPTQEQCGSKVFGKKGAGFVQASITKD